MKSKTIANLLNISVDSNNISLKCIINKLKDFKEIYDIYIYMQCDKPRINILQFFSLPKLFANCIYNNSKECNKLKYCSIWRGKLNDTTI